MNALKKSKSSDYQFWNEDINGKNWNDFDLLWNPMQWMWNQFFLQNIHLPNKRNFEIHFQDFLTRLIKNLWISEFIFMGFQRLLFYTKKIQSAFFWKPFKINLKMCHQISLKLGKKPKTRKPCLFFFKGYNGSPFLFFLICWVYPEAIFFFFQGDPLFVKISIMPFNSKRRERILWTASCKWGSSSRTRRSRRTSTSGRMAG